MVAGISPSFASDRQKCAESALMAMSLDGYKTHAACVRVALDLRDHGFVAGVDRVEHGGEAEGVGAILCVRVGGHAFHPVEVGACAECGAVCGEDDDADGVVVGERAESCGQFDDGGFVEGVADVGAIERDACYVAVDGDFQALQVHCIGHGGFSMCATWCFAEHQLSLISLRDSILGGPGTSGGRGTRWAIVWRRC